MTLKTIYQANQGTAQALDQALSVARAQVAVINREKGWYDSARTFGEDVALLHSEVSEALEEFRAHKLGRGIRTASGDEIWHEDATGVTGATYPAIDGKPLGVGSEMADILVRLLDTCERYDIDLGAEFRRKLAYNATRPHRHGGKAL